MIRFLCLLLSISCLSLDHALAQLPATPDLERIERPWPEDAAGGYSFEGADTGLACGAFLDGHDGRCAVILRGGRLYLSYEPAQFQHFAGVDMVASTLTPQAIATLPALAGGPDRLLAISSQGLHVLEYDSSQGFVSATTQAALSSWSDVIELRVAQFTPAGLATNFVLGVAPDGVRVATVDVDGTVTPMAYQPAPPNVDVYDATLVDWDVDGVPEVASVLSTSAFVLDLSGTILATFAANTSGARIIQLRGGGAPAVCMVAHVGANWNVYTWSPGPGFGVVTSGGSLTLTADPIGLSTFDLDGDADPEVVISTTDSVRVLLPGSSDGPQAGAAERIEIVDVRPDALPSDPDPNLAPMVVDDIDRDGTLDFVIPQSATNQLVVILAVRPQVQLLVHNVVDDGDAVPSVGLTSVLGLDLAPGTWALPQPATTDGLGLRLAIPASASPNMEVQVLVYDIVIDGVQPDGDDVASPQVAGRFRFPLPTGVAGQNMDIMVPVVDYDTFFTGVPHTERFLLEINLVEGGKGTAPILLEYWVVKDELGPGQLFNLMNPTAYDIWDFEGGSFPRSIWVAGQTFVTANHVVPPPQPLTPGNRYIGLIVPVKSKPISTQPPLVPSSQPLNNAVKVQ